MTTLEILLKARVEVEKGWCPHWGDQPGRVCAMGALRLVAGQTTNQWIGYDCLYAALPASHASIGDFNDEMGKGAVLALYDRAIAVETVKVAESAHEYELVPA